MKSNKHSSHKAIILTGKPVSHQPIYISADADYLTEQVQYCHDNDIEIIEMMSIPRVFDTFADWINELREIIKDNDVDTILIHTSDYDHQLFTPGMLYTSVRWLNVKILDELDYSSTESMDIEWHPEAVLVTYIPDSDDEEDDDLEFANLQYTTEVQKNLLQAVADLEGFVTANMIFTATSNQDYWYTFFQLLHTYIEINNLEAVIIQEGGCMEREFLRDLVEYFEMTDINIMVCNPELRLVCDSEEIIDPFEELDDEKELPFN